MAFDTQPAFIHSNDWDEHSRSHPAMKFMEDFTRMFDRGGVNTEPWHDWYTSDAVLHKSDGTSFQGGEARWEAAKQVYAPFTEFFHLPYYEVVTETKGGWEMLGQAYLYANLPGNRGEGEPPQVTDPRDGKKWDVKIPAGFRFQYEKGKGKHGMALKRTDLHSDGMPVGMTLIKRGVLQLG